MREAGLRIDRNSSRASDGKLVLEGTKFSTGNRAAERHTEEKF
jgi:hypothetical protein